MKISNIQIDSWGNAFILSARFGELHIINPKTFTTYDEALEAMLKEIKKEIIRYETNPVSRSNRSVNWDSLP